MRDHVKVMSIYLLWKAQGMCYSEPVLTGEDKAWRDGPSDIEYDPDVKWPQKTHRETHVSTLYTYEGCIPSAG